MADILIYGKLKNQTTDNIIAGSDQLYDDSLQKFQSEINQDLQDSIQSSQATIGNYTINGKKISENPVLSKTDIGLGNVTNEEQIPLSQKGVANGVATLDESGKITESQLPVDGEDITVNNGVLKFADRGTTNGMGYRILRLPENGILTQDQINTSNTIYEIRYDFNLNGTTITIPSNSVLKFNGGSFSNGTVIFQSTKINGYGKGISCQFSGTIIGDINVLLFGISESINTERLQNIISIAEEQGNTVYFPSNIYSINDIIYFNQYLSIRGDGSSTIFNISDNSGFYCNVSNTNVAVKLYLQNFCAQGSYSNTNPSETNYKFIYFNINDDDFKTSTDDAFPYITNSQIINCVFRKFDIAIDWKRGFFWSEINNNWFVNNKIALCLGNANSVNISQNSFRDNREIDIMIVGSKANMVSAGTTIIGNDFSGTGYGSINIVNGELQYSTISENYIEPLGNAYFIIVGGKYTEYYNGIPVSNTTYSRSLLLKSKIDSPLNMYSNTSTLKKNLIYIDNARVQNCIVNGGIEISENTLDYYKEQTYFNSIINSIDLLQILNVNNYKTIYRKQFSENPIVLYPQIPSINRGHIPKTPIINGIAIGEENNIEYFNDYVCIPANSYITIRDLSPRFNGSHVTSRIYVEYYESSDSNIQLQVYDNETTLVLGTYTSNDFYYGKNLYSQNCTYNSIKKCYIDTDNTHNILIRLNNISDEPLASRVIIKIYKE